MTESPAISLAEMVQAIRGAWDEMKPIQPEKTAFWKHSGQWRLWPNHPKHTKVNWIGRRETNWSSQWIGRPFTEEEERNFAIALALASEP